MYENEFALEPTAEAVQASRDLVRRTLLPVGSDLAEVAAILTDEIVANAVRHGRPPIALTVRGDDDLILIAVADGGPGFPVVRCADRTDECGRGMMILDVLSDEWGVIPLPQGKQVWFRLRVPDADRMSTTTR